MECEKYFAQRLKYVRLCRGLSQKELGAKIGVEYSAVSNWELGYNVPTLKMFRRLCVALGVAPGDLLNLVVADLDEEERTLVEEYRELDEDGKHTVRAVIDSQLLRLNK